MMLSDYEIHEAHYAADIDIQPFDSKYVQPASYDVHLGSKLLLPEWPAARSQYVDPSQNDAPMREIDIPPHNEDIEKFYLAPGGVALGYTTEVVRLNPDVPIAADIAGCSSLGRCFLFVHVTAGFIDPGWSGQLTLELYNASPWWLRLWAGMRIAQIRFYRMGRLSKRPYNVAGHYAGSVGPVESRYTS